MRIYANLKSINQSDQQELGIQVNNMRNIYQKSSTTMIYLGPDIDGYGKMAISAIQKLANNICNDAKVQESALNDFADLREVMDKVDYVVDDSFIDSQTWDAMTWLFNLPWFGRVWVIQELNTSLSAVTYCGESSTDSQHVALVANWIRASSNYVDKQFYKTLVNSAAFMRLKNFRDSTELLMTIHMATTYNATDPRDRVYAMLGLPVFSSLSPSINADYTLSTIEVYRIVVELSIRVLGNLDGLSYVMHPRNEISRPSWVPLLHNNSGNPVICTLPEWKACGSRAPLVTINQRENVLLVRGIRLDTITSCDELVLSNFGLNPLGKNDTDLQRVSSVWRDFLRPTKRYNLDEKGLAAYAASLSCGIHYTDERGDEEVLRLYFVIFLEWLCGDLSPIPQYWRQLASKRLSETSEYDPLPTRRHWNRWIRNKKVFRTANGYVGTANISLRDGDQVCILFGGNVPYILRPENDHYLLIGEAYVHGVMDGEVIQEYEKGGLNSMIEKDFMLV
jgi:Heterokaryon incompatibility protein (HET)